MEERKVRQGNLHNNPKKKERTMQGALKTNCINCLVEIPRVITKIKKVEVITCSDTCTREQINTKINPPEKLRALEVMLNHHKNHGFHFHNPLKSEQEPEVVFAWDESSVLL